jgi:hypothetical protein
MNIQNAMTINANWSIINQVHGNQQNHFHSGQRGALRHDFLSL